MSYTKEIIIEPILKIINPIIWSFFLPYTSATLPKGSISAHIVKEEIITTQATDLNVIERSAAILGSDIVVTTISKTNINKAIAATITIFQRLKDEEYSPVFGVKNNYSDSNIYVIVYSKTIIWIN